MNLDAIPTVLKYLIRSNDKINCLLERVRNNSRQ